MALTDLERTSTSFLPPILPPPRSRSRSRTPPPIFRLQGEIANLNFNKPFNGSAIAKAIIDPGHISKEIWVA
jgi:hypothetical protein